MTATRMIRGVTVLAAVALWLVAAAWLWRTDVPSGLRLGHVATRALLSPYDARRAASHDGFLRVDWLAAELAQLGALGLVAWRPPRRRPLLVAAAALAAWWAAGLPFAFAAQWWENRYGLAHGGYGSVVQPNVLVGLVLGTLVVAGLVATARRLGRRWWLVATPLLVGLGALVLLVSPLLAGSGKPLGRGVYVEHVSATTTEANAFEIGLGPTQRIVLWDTVLDGRFSRAAVGFLLAHERTHERRRHVLKGLAWFGLFAAAGTFVVSRVVRLETPGAAARALLLVLALQLALLPLTNAIARRYEAEADWGALEATRDPAAARELMRGFARTSLEQPNPPIWSYLLLDAHPTLAQRVALADAWAARASGRASRAGSSRPRGTPTSSRRRPPRRAAPS